METNNFIYHTPDLSFRYECPETEAIWRVTCQIEMQEDDDSTNNFCLGVTLCEVTRPSGTVVDIYSREEFILRNTLEAAALEEFWSRAEKACQKSQHFADNIL